MAACSTASTTPTSPTPAPTTVSVTISGGGVLAHKGQTLQLKAIAILSDGTQVDVTAKAVWRSHNPAVITVSATGLVTAEAPGACDVEAASDGVKGQAKLEVLGAIERLEVSGSLTFSKHGETSQLKAMAYYQGGATKDVTAEVTWGSTDSEVVAINNSGMATARRDGDCDITAIHGSLTARAGAKVRAGLRIINLRIAGNLTLVLLGQASHLKAIAELSDGTEIDVTAQAVWRTTNSGVATVGGGGLLQAIGLGDCDVTAVHAGVTAHARVNVILEALKVVKLTIFGLTKLRVGETLNLKAIAVLSDGSEMDVTDATSWTTSNVRLALFARAGLLTGLLPGTCDVIAVHGGVTVKAAVQITLLDEPEDQP